MSTTRDKAGKTILVKVFYYDFVYLQPEDLDGGDNGKGAGTVERLPEYHDGGEIGTGAGTVERVTEN